MQIVIEILREGGLRLPSKIAQTLSVVGGFIIGNAALQAKLVSPATSGNSRCRNYRNFCRTKL